MNSLLTTLPPPSSAATSRTILSERGYQASLITLPAGSELTLDEGRNTQDQIVFVVEGEATLHVGDADSDVNTILTEDQAQHLSGNKPHVFVARSGATAKILRVSIPPRQVISPPIESFER